MPDTFVRFSSASGGAAWVRAEEVVGVIEHPDAHNGATRARTRLQFSGGAVMDLRDEADAVVRALHRGLLTIERGDAASNMLR